MCANFEGVKDPRIYAELFDVNPPAASGSEVEGKNIADGKPGVVLDVWPGYVSSFIRNPPETDAGDEAATERKALAGAFGLIPHWTKDPSITRSPYNARSENVADKPSSLMPGRRRSIASIQPKLSMNRVDAVRPNQQRRTWNGRILPSPLSPSKLPRW